MIYIDNLISAVDLIIEKRIDGVICLQDVDSPNMNKLIQNINTCFGKNKRISNFPWNLMRVFKKSFVKLFGGIFYDNSLLNISKESQIISTPEAIKRSISNED